jgi:uncharacterized Zn-binding protein involved in type VI secretion
MGQPAARQGDKVTGIDTHVVMVPAPPAPNPVPTPLPHPFSGTITGETISSVTIGGMPAAVVGSTATNAPPHVPTPPGTAFQKPPANKGTVSAGSGTVTIGGKAAARAGDSVRTCNDPQDADTSAIAGGEATVTIG